MTKERWRHVKGYEGLYMVSDCGRIKSLARTINRNNNTTQTFAERVRTGYVGNNGYAFIGLAKNGKPKIDPKKLMDMVSMCQMIVYRLYDNEDILIPSKNENKINAIKGKRHD